MLNRSINIVLAVTVAVLGAGEIPAASDTPAITLQPGQRQLFLDDFAIAEISGLARTVHRPEKRGAVIRPDIPTDGTLIQTRCEPVWSPEDHEYKTIYYACGGGALGTGMSPAVLKQELDDLREITMVYDARTADVQISARSSTQQRLWDLFGLSTDENLLTGHDPISHPQPAT